MPRSRQLQTAELDALPFASDVYKRDLQIERYNVPFLLHPYVSFYTTRGCPALCTFCMWPQTISGHAWRTRSVDNVVREVNKHARYFPADEGNFLRRRHLQHSQGPRPSN